MLFFHAFLKRKAVKRTLLQTDNIFSRQIKKHRTQIKTLGISNENRIKLGISVNFLKKKHFFTLQNNDFFYFNLQFWRSATLDPNSVYFIPNCFLQPTNNYFCATESDIDLQTILYPIWIIGFSTVTYIKLWRSVKALQENALKI